jgi:adenylate kinase family enzyme
MSQKVSYIFLLGRPGCGKSTAYKALTPKLEAAGVASDFERVDDFPKLWNLFQTDTEFRRCRRTEDGDYKVTDDTVWDDVLAELGKDAEARSSPGKIIFIEFARDSYIRALENFPSRVIAEAVLVYIACSFDMCWERIIKRHEAAVAEGTDDHYVAREEMEKTYLHDDVEELTKKFKDIAVVANNEKEGARFVDKLAEDVLSIIESRS